MMSPTIRWDIILGGFGLFMFGINFMGDGLKAAAGDKLRTYIDRYTANPLSALLIGILITIVMQSSSASTAITIGLVRAGMMSLEQAAGIVMGANIGTTITSVLISLDIDQYVLYIVFLGAMIGAFGKKQKTKSFGNILLGFGLIFYGLNSMGDALSAIKDMPVFIEFAESMSTNPILSLFAGTVMTGAVQASAATIGVVQKMYAAGALSFSAVLPFVFGANIGTTVTGILAAVGGSTAAKRTAGIHTLFNIVGTTLGMLLLGPFTHLILWLTGIFGLNGEMQIAMAHIVFNTTTTIVFFPFLHSMCNLIRKVIPGEESKKLEVSISGLDSKLADEMPALAISSAGNVIESMAEAVKHDVDNVQTFLNAKTDEEDFEHQKQLEASINDYDKKITDYLVGISGHTSLSPSDSAALRVKLEVVKNLERIADLAMNVAEFYKMVSDQEEKFSEQAKTDMESMFSIFDSMFDLTMRVYTNQDAVAFGKLQQLEEELDATEFASRQSHFTRMANEECSSAIAASIYCDILGTIERMGDHALNVAKVSMANTVTALADEEIRVS